uniref:Uncharacterized protein n=1 Tax=Coturnix japonica TaxID=93934 RepID=A0A8C2UDC2_COTJA
MKTNVEQILIFNEDCIDPFPALNVLIALGAHHGENVETQKFSEKFLIFLCPLLLASRKATLVTSKALKTRDMLYSF